MQYSSAVVVDVVTAAAVAADAVILLRLLH
jgi:hypothetical protein